MRTSQILSFFLVFCFFISTTTSIKFQRERECTPVHYGNRGDSCDGVKRKCKNFYMCKNGECTYSNLGRACEKNEDCFLHDTRGEGVRCVEKICVKPRYNGYSCNHNGECFGQKCEGNVCVGAKEGETCDPATTVRCDKGLYCSTQTKKCVKQLTTGQPCNDFDAGFAGNAGSNFNVICTGGLKCMGAVNHKSCIKFRDGKVGEPCNYEVDKDDECEYGLHCDPKRNQCVSNANLGETFACKGADRNCSVTEHEQCVCHHETDKPHCVSTLNRHCDLFAALNKWRDCASAHNCPFDSNPEEAFLLDTIEPNTCMGKYCSQISKEYLCCAHEPHRRNKYSQVSVGPLGCDHGSPGGVVVVLLILFAIIAGGVLILVSIGLVYYLKFYSPEKSKFESLE